MSAIPTTTSSNISSGLLASSMGPWTRARRAWPQFLGVTLLLLFLICCATPAATPASTPSKPSICKQSTIDALSALHANLEFPDYLAEGGARKPAEEFDVNETFSVLSHLSMEPGYALDYVYYSEFVGGLPVLYARPVDRAPYLTYAELITATNTAASSPPPANYREYVRVDGTAEGFFELALFHLMGNQFYLSWHAGYNDATAICDRSGLEAIVSALEKSKFGQPITAKQARQARALDLEPVVEFEDDTVTVKFVSFTRWGGFLQNTFTFRRESPHALIASDETELVPYECGVVF